MQNNPELHQKAQNRAIQATRPCFVLWQPSFFSSNVNSLPSSVKNEARQESFAKPSPTPLHAGLSFSPSLV